MNLVISWRLCLHLFFNVLYFIVFILLNWEHGAMSFARLTMLFLIGSAGIAIAYQTRYMLILGFRKMRWLRVACCFAGSLLGLGLIGYMLLHGVKNSLGQSIVAAEPTNVWVDYSRAFLHWYANFAKYGAIFFGIEEKLFQLWDQLWGYWQFGYTLSTSHPMLSVASDYSSCSTTSDAFVSVPVAVIPLLRQASDLLGFSKSTSVLESDSCVAEEPPPVSAHPPVDAPLPEHVTINWILDYLNVGRSTFYRRIRNQILFEVCKIGARSYYLKSDVTGLMIRHEKGAWTFSKYLKERQRVEAFTIPIL